MCAYGAFQCKQIKICMLRMEASNTEETFNNGKKKHASVIAWTEVGATSG